MGLKNILIESKGGRGRNGAPLVRVSAPIFSSLFFGFLLDLFRLLKPKVSEVEKRGIMGRNSLSFAKHFYLFLRRHSFEKGRKALPHILEKVMRIFFLGGGEL